MYADDTGPGTATTYTVRAEAPEHDEARAAGGGGQRGPADHRPDAAHDARGGDRRRSRSRARSSTRAPSTRTPSSSTGVTARPPVPAPVVAGAFSATHRYADDNPSATDRDVMPVSVVVKDKDNASTDEFGTQTVANTPAYGLTFEPRNVLTDGTTVFTRTGRIISWAGAVSDKSVVDLLLAEIGWGDGLATDVLLTNNGDLSRPLAAEHGWTEPCLYQVTADVADDDLGSAGQVGGPVVVTRATADKHGGSSWWTRQFRALAAGKTAALTPAQASCYLAVARHVSPTFDRKVRLGSTAAAYEVLTMKRPADRRDQAHAGAGAAPGGAGQARPGDARRAARLRARQAGLGRAGAPASEGRLRQVRSAGGDGRRGQGEPVGRPDRHDPAGARPDLTAALTAGRRWRPRRGGRCPARRSSTSRSRRGPSRPGRGRSG